MEGKRKWMLRMKEVRESGKNEATVERESNETRRERRKRK